MADDDWHNSAEVKAARQLMVDARQQLFGLPDLAEDHPDVVDALTRVLAADEAYVVLVSRHLALTNSPNRSYGRRLKAGPPGSSSSPANGPAGP